MTAPPHPALATAALLHAGGAPGAWGNLGCWPADHEPDVDYATAACALADAVGQVAELSAGDRVASLGCGAGEELLRWRERFGVAQVLGIEREPALVGVARLRIAGCAQGAGIEVLDSADLVAALLARPAAFDAVVVVDAAYHLGPRAAWVAAAARALKPGGRLAYTDLVLSAGACRNWLRLPALLAGVGFADLSSEEGHHQQLLAAGLCDVRLRRLDDAVLGGFARFVRTQRRRLGAQARGPAWRRVAGTAALIGPCRAAGLGYALISAGRSAGG